MIDQERPSLTIVIPLYNEEDYLRANPSLLRTWQKLHKEFQKHIRIVFCDGGSSDQTFSLLTETLNDHKKGIELIRGEVPKPSVLSSLKLVPLTSLSPTVMVCPIDCFLSQEALSQLLFNLKKGEKDRPKVGAFPKTYKPFSRELGASRLAGLFLLRAQEYWLNHWCLKRGRLFVWTNGPFFDRELFRKLIIETSLEGFLADIFISQKIKNEEEIFVMKERIMVSPRRYLRHGVLTQIFRNLRVLLGLRIGHSSKKLEGYYKGESARDCP